jgi:fructose-1,6-bisphosphatase
MIVELQTVPIYLTQEEARLFLKFQKHFKLFELLEEKKAFEIKHGTVTIDFNGDGDIKGIFTKQFYPL